VTTYDAIVIGTGQAGPYVTSRLAGAGMKVAVIQRNAFEVRKYSGRITDGSLLYDSAKGVSEAKARYKRQASDGKQDL
jgi:pyruvate/2-oxoglutarate dehydrogenase complex dihydrolipoamide dehydrogenase (E3) component